MAWHYAENVTMTFRTFLVPLVLLLCVIGRYDVTLVNADVTDEYGNKIENGIVTWVDIPVGNRTYVTVNSYDDGGLGQLFAFARSFINTVQPNDFPFSKCVWINTLYSGR